MRYGCLILVLLILGGIGAGGYYWYSRSNAPLSWTTEKVTRGEIKQVVSSTGSLDALTKVDVGCQISGILASITVDFNDRVTAGQQIAQIDPATLEAQVLQSTANLEQAKASERNLEAQIANLQANLLSAKSEQTIQEANRHKTEVAVAEAKRQYDRTKGLFERKLISQADLDASRTTYDTQKATLDGAKAQVEASKSKQQSVLSQIEATKAQREGAQAQIRQAQAQLNVSQINLGRTRITSPIDGVVIQRKVDVGQTVAASLQAPSLFTIANDLSKMIINTAVDEADIGLVKVGQVANFTVDAYRGRTFKGTVSQIRLSPVVSQNVVTYSVIVSVDNPDMSLLPGMTASVEILTEQRPDALRLPTKALFFKMPANQIPVRFEKQAETASNAVRIWVLGERGRPKPVEVITGISGSPYTEVVKGDLAADQEVITGQEKAGEGTGTGAGTGRRRSGIRIR